MTEQIETQEVFMAPVPLVAPFGYEVTSAMVEAVWDCFVKPEQDAGPPPSGEMCILMAILRSVFQGLEEAEKPDDA